MTNPKSSSSTYKQKKKKKSTSKQKSKLPPSMIKRGSKWEVVFDAEARKAHLRGFSERKRQRRAFGLAMQKVKDRKAKIEQRAAEKKDELQRVEEAERQKEELMEEVVRMNSAALASFGEKMNEDSDREQSCDGDSDEEDSDQNQEKKKQQGEEQKQSVNVINTKIYDDRKTEKTWGGQVTVTTSEVQLEDNSDGGDGIDQDAHVRNDKPVDAAQKYAGNVRRYMDELKGNMPGKKNRDGSKAKRKGRNGAADMKGAGGSGSIKIASKLLSKSKGKRSLTSNKKGKKRRR